MPIQTNREQWLNEAADLIMEDILTHNVEGRDKPPVRVSVAPMKSKKIVSQCYQRAQSKSGHNEIFVTAHSDDSYEILFSLLQSLILAYDDCQGGKKGFFARVAKNIGIIGKMTKPAAGIGLFSTLKGYIGILGDIPHAALDIKPVQKGRNNNKLHCKSCGFQANLSRKWVEAIRENDARCADNGTLWCIACNAESVEIIEG